MALYRILIKFNVVRIEMPPETFHTAINVCCFFFCFFFWYGVVWCVVKYFCKFTSKLHLYTKTLFGKIPKWPLSHNKDLNEREHIEHWYNQDWLGFSEMARRELWDLKCCKSNAYKIVFLIPKQMSNAFYWTDKLHM